LAVPGSPLDPRTKGTNDLIRQGAIICEGAEDVLRALAALPSAREGGDPYDPHPPRHEGHDAETDRLRERIADLLSPTPIPRDELVRRTGAPAPVVYAALTELALAGRADLLAGGLVTQG
jgi:DNA processing protein